MVSLTLQSCVAGRCLSREENGLMSESKTRDSEVYLPSLFFNAGGVRGGDRIHPEHGRKSG